jgi:hypothetical protein
MTTTATRPVSEDTPKAGSRDRSRRTVAVTVAADAAGAMRSAAEDAATRLPGLASMGRSAFDDANRRIESSSDEMVRMGTVLSFGFAVGLLIGGAPRILVGAALVPAGMLGLALLERTASGGPSASTRAAAGL